MANISRLLSICFVFMASDCFANSLSNFLFGDVGKKRANSQSSEDDADKCHGAGSTVMLAGAKGCQDEKSKSTKVGGACTPAKPVNYCLGGKASPKGAKMKLSSGGVSGKNCHGIDCSGFIMGKLCAEGKFISPGKSACDSLGAVQTRQMYDQWGKGDSCFTVVDDAQACDGDILVRAAPGGKPGHVITVKVDKEKFPSGCLPKDQLDEAGMAHSGSGGGKKGAGNGPNKMGLMEYLAKSGAGKVQAMYQVIKNLGKKKAETPNAKLLRYSKEDRCKAKKEVAKFPENIECLKRSCPSIQKLSQCFPSK